MYDILQLNDMLVPELLDIAEQLKISGAKKFDKQELVYKILDKQAVVASETKDDADGKPRRKRIIKTSTANNNEEAIVESGDTENKRGEMKRDLRKKDDRPIIKKPRRREDEDLVPPQHKNIPLPEGNDINDSSDDGSEIDEEIKEPSQEQESTIDPNNNQRGESE